MKFIDTLLYMSWVEAKVHFDDKQKVLRNLCFKILFTYLNLGLSFQRLFIYFTILQYF